MKSNERDFGNEVACVLFTGKQKCHMRTAALTCRGRLLVKVGIGGRLNEPDRTESDRVSEPDEKDTVEQSRINSGQEHTHTYTPHKHHTHTL